MPIAWSRPGTNAPEPGVFSSGLGSDLKPKRGEPKAFRADGDVSIEATDRPPFLRPLSPRVDGIAPGIPIVSGASSTPRLTKTSTSSCGSAGATEIEKRRQPGSGVLLAPRSSAMVSLCKAWLSDGAGSMLLTDANASRHISISSAWRPVMVCSFGISARGRAPISSVRADTANASRAPLSASCRSLGLWAELSAPVVCMGVFGED